MTMATNCLRSKAKGERKLEELLSRVDWLETLRKVKPVIVVLHALDVLQVHAPQWVHVPMCVHDGVRAGCVMHTPYHMLMSPHNRMPQLALPVPTFARCVMANPGLGVPCSATAGSRLHSHCGTPYRPVWEICTPAPTAPRGPTWRTSS